MFKRASFTMFSLSECVGEQNTEAKRWSSDLMCHNNNGNNNNRRNKNISETKRELIWLNTKRNWIYYYEPMRRLSNSWDFLRSYLMGWCWRSAFIKEQHLGVCTDRGALWLHKSVTSSWNLLTFFLSAAFFLFSYCLTKTLIVAGY